MCCLVMQSSPGVGPSPCQAAAGAQLSCCRAQRCKCVACKTCICGNRVGAGTGKTAPTLFNPLKQRVQRSMAPLFSSCLVNVSSASVEVQQTARKSYTADCPQIALLSATCLHHVPWRRCLCSWWPCPRTSSALPGSGSCGTHTHLLAGYSFGCRGHACSVLANTSTLADVQGRHVQKCAPAAAMMIETCCSCKGTLTTCRRSQERSNRVCWKSSYLQHGMCLLSMKGTCT